ncbi:MAG: molecular chaperone TorD family protein [Sulfuricurvum sp.]|nr:molecular chaperone TorD family protein [Sulfuricurvum sp.]
MNNEYRLYIYAFLSRVMSDIPDRRFINDLKNNESLLEIIGEETKEWILSTDNEAIYDQLNTDFTSMFILNTQPVESFVLDAKNETLVGLQNPVMAFYFTHGFEVNMDQTEIMAPDHLGIELAFMQTLVYRNEEEPQLDFLDQHIFPWVVPYMMGMKSMADTPFYRDLCDFIVEFLTADYAYLTERRTNG